MKLLINAETVSEASSAPTVDKKRWEPIYSYNVLVNLYGAGRRESWQRYSFAKRRQFKKNPINSINFVLIVIDKKWIKLQVLFIKWCKFGLK